MLIRVFRQVKLYVTFYIGVDKSFIDFCLPSGGYPLVELCDLRLESIEYVDEAIILGVVGLVYHI